MSKFMENVAIINSAVRTTLGVVLVGGLGVGGYVGYNTYHSKDIAIDAAKRELALAQEEVQRQEIQIQEKQRAIESLKLDVEKKQQEIDRLDTAMRLLKVDQRVARLTALDQVAGEAGQVITKLEFQELDRHGQPLDSPRQFTIPGDIVYVDSWVVKFDDKYVEASDLHRATSLVLFRRLFGEHQKPFEGLALDEVGGRPKAYGRDGAMSEFEKKIWGDFWTVANDESKQDDLGIRAAHGEAPSMKVQKGKTYRLELRSSGGLTITPESTAPPTRKPDA